MPWEPEPPFLLPDIRALLLGGEEFEPLTFLRPFEFADSLLGVVHGLEEKALEWLYECSGYFEEWRVRLIVAVYPACPTQRDTLEGLIHEAKGSKGNIEFRLLPLAAWTSFPLTTLCAWSAEGNPVFWMGSSPNFMLDDPNPTDINICFEAQPLLAQKWRNHFDWLWHAKATPLNEKTARIPALAPARGTKAAAEKWQAYLSACEAQQAEGADSGVRIEVNPETGEIKAFDSGGNEIPPPSEEAKVPKLDKIAAEIARAFAKGQLITIDKLTRIPPLDAPVRAELLGMESLRHMGTVSRTTQFRISLIDDKELKKINNARKATSQLLPRFSFRLADGARWIPKAAIPLFVKELEGMEKEGKERVHQAVGGDLDNLIDRKRGSVANDMQAFFREVNPGGTVPEDSVKQVLDDLRQRFEKALQGRFLPEVTYATVAFNPPSSQQPGTSTWGQALSLLHDAAVYTRNLISNSYATGGIKTTDKKELLVAMNIFNDTIVDPDGRYSESEATQELNEISRIMQTREDNQRQKCENILAILHRKRDG